MHDYSPCEDPCCPPLPVCVIPPLFCGSMGLVAVSTKRKNRINPLKSHTKVLFLTIRIKTSLFAVGRRDTTACGGYAGVKILFAPKTEDVVFDF